jgi:hypothetical protein
LLRILHNNYRNAVNVTEVANRLLKLKHARFGSVDRESNYLVRSNAETSGTVLLLADTAPITRELNQKTRQSTRFAVAVMHPEHKPAARAHFQTPLIFSIQEAKGLEYDNIILYNSPLALSRSPKLNFRRVLCDLGRLSFQPMTFRCYALSQAAQS